MMNIITNGYKHLTLNAALPQSDEGKLLGQNPITSSYGLWGLAFSDVCGVIEILNGHVFACEEILFETDKIDQNGCFVTGTKVIFDPFNGIWIEASTTSVNYLAMAICKGVSIKGNTAIAKIEFNLKDLKSAFAITGKQPCDLLATLQVNYKPTPTVPLCPGPPPTWPSKTLPSISPIPASAFCKPASSSKEEYGVYCTQCNEFYEYAVKKENFLCWSCKHAKDIYE
jgi:hypothetical protein